MGILEALKNFFNRHKLEEEFVVFLNQIAKLKGKNLSEEEIGWVKKEISAFSGIFADKGYIEVNKRLKTFLSRILEKKSIDRYDEDLLRRALAILEGKEQERIKTKRERLKNIRV